MGAILTAEWETGDCQLWFIAPALAWARENTMADTSDSPNTGTQTETVASSDTSCVFGLSLEIPFWSFLKRLHATMLMVQYGCVPISPKDIKKSNPIKSSLRMYIKKKFSKKRSFIPLLDIACKFKTCSVGNLNVEEENGDCKM